MDRTIKIMLSNRHIHLTEDAVKTLFGEEGVHFKNYLFGNKGQYACEETVTLAGPKGNIEGVRVLGPLRKYVQTEILKGDCFKLGVQAPVNLSGNLEGAATVKVIGPCGELELPCAIIARRHIHMTADVMEAYGLEDHQLVDVKIPGVRALTFSNVVVEKAPNGPVMHIDTEEGNAAGIKNNDVGEIVL